MDNLTPKPKPDHPVLMPLILIAIPIALWAIDCYVLGGPKPLTFKTEQASSNVD